MISVIWDLCTWYTCIVVTVILCLTISQAVDKETHGKEATEEGDHGLDLEENLQDDLCKLWDMAMNGVG